MVVFCTLNYNAKILLKNTFISHQWKLTKHSDIGLDHSNITSTVTDNGSKIVRAFSAPSKAEHEPQVQSHHTVGWPASVDDEFNDSDDGMDQFNSIRHEHNFVLFR